MQKRFTEEQIIGILRAAEVDGAVIREVCRKHNITEQTFFRWRNKFLGGCGACGAAQHSVWSYDFVHDRLANGGR